jgi:hypothetical protein
MKTAYARVRKEAEKPGFRREAIVHSPRGAWRVPRKYHLTDKELGVLVRGWRKTGIFPNPYSRNGVIHCIVQALINLGINRFHNFLVVKGELQVLMEGVNSARHRNLWDAFVGRRPRNKMTAMDVNGRILQNIKMYQRLHGNHPYGMKLQQVRACLDIVKGLDSSPSIRLNTMFHRVSKVKPINEFKVIKD